MRIDLDLVTSLTEFQRATKAWTSRLRREGKPLLLTVNGRAALVVQSAPAYQDLLDHLDRVETLEGIREGLADAEAGRVHSVEEAFAILRRRLPKAPKRARRG